MFDAVGLGLVGMTSLILYVFNFWRPWDKKVKRLWDEYGNMAEVRKHIGKTKYPLLGVIGFVWAIGIGLQITAIIID